MSEQPNNSSRRTLLKSTLAIGILGAAGYGGYRLLNETTAEPRIEPTTPLEMALDAVTTTEGLKTHISGIDQPIEQLSQLINYQGSDTAQSVEDRINQRIQDDFITGETQIVDGWQLSNTELLVMASAFAVYKEQSVEKPQQDQTFENAPYEEFIQLKHWGPSKTYQGFKFNEQPDGHCGIWVVGENVPDNVRVFIGGVERKATISEQGFTTGIFKNIDAFIGTIDTYDVVAYDDIMHRKQKLGTFEVLPPIDFYTYPDGRVSKVFTQVEKWGPRTTSSGQPFNQQPSGDSAFWIRMKSLSGKAKIKLNGETMTTSVQPDLITARINNDLVPTKPGKYPLEIYDPESGESLVIGEFTVTN